MKLYNAILTYSLFITFFNIADSRMSDGMAHHLLSNASKDVKRLIKEIKEHKNSVLQVDERNLPSVVTLNGKSEMDKAIWMQAIAKECNVPLMMIDCHLLCTKYQEYAGSVLSQNIDEISREDNSFVIIILSKFGMSADESNHFDRYMLSDVMNKKFNKDRLLFVVTNSLDEGKAILSNKWKHAVVKLDCFEEVGLFNIIPKFIHYYSDQMPA